MNTRTEEIFMIDCGQYIVNVKKIRYVKYENDGAVTIYLDKGDILRLPREENLLNTPSICEQLTAFNPLKHMINGRYKY